MKKFNYGIWLDHKRAFIIKHGFGLEEIKTVVNATEGLLRVPGLSSDSTNWGFPGGSNNEYKKNELLRSELNNYFKSISKHLELCDEILLFGPTTAKREFYNYLKEKKILKESRIFIKSSDKMDEKAMFKFVDDFFVNTRSLKV